MNFEYFIAKRIHFEKKGKKNVSRPAVRIATIAIAVGLAVMIVAVGVVIGFKKEIRNKTIGFGSHIQISNFDTNNTYEMQPIKINDTLMANLEHIPNVKHIQRFVTKPGIIKTGTAFQGIILKGVGTDYSWDFFKSNLLEGTIPELDDSTPRNEALISKSIADLLGLKLGDSFYTYFLQDQMRVRKLKITGIYSTNFEEYDKMFVLTDIRTAQKLNGWEEDKYGGLEILISECVRRLRKPVRSKRKWLLHPDHQTNQSADIQLVGSARYECVGNTPVDACCGRL